MLQSPIHAAHPPSAAKPASARSARRPDPAPGMLVQTVSIAVRGDRIKEGNETFLVNLRDPIGATLLDGQGKGTIGKDD
jgi:hypothetical protein